MSFDPFKTSGLALASGLALGALLLSAAPADACGGFFCNNSGVDQTGEQILFAQQGDSIEAHVAINYQGEAADFAWIVPTPTRPEVGISTPNLFQALAGRTSARYQLQWEEDGCFFAFPQADSAGGGNNGASGNNGGNGGVTVVEQSSVGPFDFAVLQATDVMALFDWLNANEYFIPDSAQEFVDPYIMDGGDIHFVAFKLQKNRDVGEIQPVKMKYNSTKPMIPIQLTAIASQPDMGVTVHILGERRAVPENYLHVHPNEALIDWLHWNPGNNYNQLINAAMDEAGGQGFTTEFAGSTEVMADALYREGQFDLDRLAGISDPAEFIRELQNQGFLGNAMLLSLFERFIPLPAELVEQGVEPRQYYNCIECYDVETNSSEFDAEAFANELEMAIVEPLRHAQGLFNDIPYLTRMYTTLSAEEMTLDPVFAYNPDMEDVENVRIATARTVGDGSCDEGTPVVITLPDGREIETTFSYDGQGIDIAGADDAAAVVELTAESGEPTVVKSITQDLNMLDEVIADRENGNVGGSGGGGGMMPGGWNPQGGVGNDDSSASSGGCAVSPVESGAPVMALALLALGLVAFRRRR